MRTRAILWAAAALLAGCSAAMNRGELVSKLSHYLAEVRASSDRFPVDLREPAGLAPLRGMTLDEIEAAFGLPDCQPGGARRCLEGATLDYAFYKLPPTYVGGGRTLLVYADGQGRCTDARWIFTE